MSRSGYVDECDDILQFGRWQGRVASAMRGKRGQKLLRDLRDALDEMPVKRLIKDELVEDGEYCALGVLGAKRGLDMDKLDPEDGDQVGKAFDIAPCMAQDIVFTNDEEYHDLTPEIRWKRMRAWVDGLIARTPEERAAEEAIQKDIASRGWFSSKPKYINGKFERKEPYYNTSVEISEDGINVIGTVNYVYNRKRTNPDKEQYFDHGPGFATDGTRGEKKDMMIEVKYWRYPQAK